MKASQKIALPLACAVLTGLAVAPSLAYPGGRQREVKKPSTSSRTTEVRGIKNSVLGAVFNQSRLPRSQRQDSNGGIAGAVTSFSTCFEPYSVGNVNGQSGWQVFPTGSTGSNITTSVSGEPEGTKSLTNALSGEAAGTFQGAESPIPGTPIGPGRFTVSYKIKIGATGGADYFTDCVSDTAGLVVARVRYYYADTTLDADATPGDVLIVDESPTTPGTFVYRSAGLNYTPGATLDVRLDINSDTNVIKYFFNNVYATTGKCWSRTGGVEVLDFYSDNFQIAETAKLDCLSLENANGLCKADIAKNNAVDSDDLLAIIQGWGTCPVPANCPADIAVNGAVDADDLLLVIQGWGACPVPVGACCVLGACQANKTYNQCLALSGIYQGNGIGCGAVVCPSSNDECLGASTIASLPFSQTVTVSSYTANASDPDTSCEIAGGGPFTKVGGWWYKFTPSFTGPITVKTCTSAGVEDSVVGVFTGTCTGLTEQFCNDDGCEASGFGRATASGGVVSGTTYYIFIDNYSGGGSGGGGAFGPVTVTITSP